VKKNIRVEVTQEDIDEGVRRASYKCMMARAIARTVNRVVMVTARSAAIDEPMGGSATKRLWYELTDTAIRRLKAFDDGEPVKPFVTIIRGI